MTWILHHLGWLALGLIVGVPWLAVFAFVTADLIRSTVRWARSLRRYLRAAHADDAFAQACALTGPTPIQPDEIRWRTDAEWAALENLFHEDYDAWKANR